MRKDWPFPVDIGALMFDQDTGALKGVGIYLRIPIPWEDYLVEWPKEERGEDEAAVSVGVEALPSGGKQPRKVR